MDTIIEVNEQTSVELIPEEINPLQGVGIYPDIDEKVYRDYKAVNQSLLKSTLGDNKSLWHFKYWYDKIGVPREVDEEKRAELVIGTAVHCAVLEPKKFAETYINTGCRSKALKDYKDAVKENPGKICLSKKEYAICEGVLESLSHAKTARQLLEIESLNEVTAIWDFPERIVANDLNIHCKARADRYITLNGKPCIVDLKTTQNASTDEFSKSIGSWGYHIQAAFYLDGFSRLMEQMHNQFIIIAIEKEPPFAIAVHQLDPEDIRTGRMIFVKYLHDIAHAMHFNEWPCYPDTIQSIRLPRWYYADKD